jgi:SAM-dependent methyltransferase
MSEADRQKWNARYAAQGPETTVPSAFVCAQDDLLPRRGLALDVAGGAGRHALWLAGRGLETTLADISEVALGLAREAADRAGIALRTACVDLEREPLPAGPWDVIVCVSYLQRSLFPAFGSALAPGGLLLFSQPTRENLVRHARPGPDFLLEPGELRGLAGGLEVLRLEEGWDEEGRHTARLVARRAHIQQAR